MKRNSLSSDEVVRLLQQIDLVESELRSQEGRLTRIREELWESIGGKYSLVLSDGRERPRP